ncbi:hypothetical protein [Halobacteriovorax sp.]|uniref:hypothetical protein n=1 Tax=Halobacteriovorax sp. TaxID=2020862 RepID=UPI003564CBA4
MKKILGLTLIFLTFSILAEEELSIQLSVSGQKLSIVKTYIGEPVSRGRQLVVTTSCSEKKTELYRDNFCDFEKIKVDDSSVSFTVKFYNPDTGECTSPKKENVNLKIKKCD